MAIYAIGDIQGCFDALRRLLDKVGFDPARDRLWSVGDLVNRGPGSLETLRFFRALGDAGVAVLGNHDLHLLAVHAGTQPLKKKDTFQALLAAEDADALMDWLRHRPLMHADDRCGVAITHAGLAPQWDLDTARACAAEVEAVLRGPHYRDLLEAMYGDEPRQWDDTLTGIERQRFIINAFTRMRYCDVNGRLDLKYKGAPGTQPGDLMPWFDVPGRRHRETRIAFGHWSTLGLVARPDVLALDTGCVWGGRLTVARLDTREDDIIAIDCPASLRPGQD